MSLAVANAETYTARGALEQALAANFSLQAEKLTPEIAEAGVEVEEGAFLPMLFAEAGYEDNTKSQNSIDFAALQQRIFAEENTTMKGGVGGRLPWGTSYELSVQLREMDNTVNRAGLPNALFSPEYTAFGGITLRQPLLKGFGKSVNLASLRVAQKQLIINGHESEVMVNNKCVEVLNAFYDLAYAESNVVVKEGAKSVAEQFLKEADRRRELGLLNPVDVTEAKVRLSEATEEWLHAQDFHRERQLELMRLLALDPNSQSLPEVRADLLAEAPAVDQQSYYQKALQSRPDYQMALAQVDQEKVRQSAARNERLPQLDLQFSYGVYGLSGAYGDALDTAFKGDEPQWSAGLSVSLPLSRRAAKAKSTAARLRVRQASMRADEVKHRISFDVRNAVRRLDVLSQRLATARTSVGFAEEGLKQEEARLRQGQTSGFAVSDLQRRLADARTRELAARVDLTKAVTELWAVSGQLLEKYGIEVASSERETRRSGLMAPFDAMMR